jgi:hypothetical protein
MLVLGAEEEAQRTQPMILRRLQQHSVANAVA